MIKGKKVLVVITARAGSKGLPGKNSKNLAGKPLIAWPILAAKQSRYVDHILVSTDGEHIADIAKQYQADVPFIRPKQLASDQATSFDVLEHAVKFLAENEQYFDYLVLLEPTSPLTQGDDIDKALETLLSAKSVEQKASAIVGVSDVEDCHPTFCLTVNQQGFISPYQDDFKVLRRQQLSSVYRFEGSLYISEIETLLTEKNFYHQHTLAYKVPKWQSFEIDDMTDFICVEAIMKNLSKIKESALKQDLNRVSHDD